MGLLIDLTTPIVKKLSFEILKRKTVFHLRCNTTVVLVVSQCIRFTVIVYYHRVYFKKKEKKECAPYMGSIFFPLVVAFFKDVI